jgi:hypothetical protein
MAMAAMNMVSAVGVRGKLSFKKMSAGVVSVLKKKTLIFGLRRSKLDHLTVSLKPLGLDVAKYCISLVF